MSDKTFPIQQNQSIQQVSNEIKVGIKQTRKLKVAPKVFYGDPFDFDDWGV